MPDTSIKKEHHSTLYYFQLQDNKVLYFSLHSNYPVQQVQGMRENALCKGAQAWKAQNVKYKDCK